MKVIESQKESSMRKNRTNRLVCDMRDGVQRSAFTLIELLVVIAIIALLVSILLPSLKRAQELAKQTVCLSNLKNNGTAMLMYAEENEGIVFLYTTPPSAGAVPDKGWQQFLAESGYMDDMNIAVCPSQAPVKYDSKNIDNVYGADVGDMLKIDPENPVTYTFNATFQFECYRELAKQSTPNKITLILDSIWAPSTPHGSYYPNQCWLAARNAAASIHGVHMRHDGKPGALFADGHASSCGEEELIDAGFISVFDENDDILVLSP